MLLVAEVNACLEQLAHGEIGQCHDGSFLYRLNLREALRRISATGWSATGAPRFACELRRRMPDAPRI